MALGVALCSIAILGILGVLANVAPAQNVVSEEAAQQATSDSAWDSNNAQVSSSGGAVETSQKMHEENQVLVGAIALQSMVRVSAKTCDGYLVGSGFVVAGNIVTNRHLVDGALQAKLDAMGMVVFAGVLSPQDPIDLAVLEGSMVGLPELTMAAQDPNIGDPLLFAGHARGGPVRLQTGTVHAYVDGDAYGISGPLMLIDAPSEPGFSGGPVLNEVGEVVAVLQGFDLVTELTLAIPVTSVSAWLTDVSLILPSMIDATPAASRGGGCR